MATVKLSSMPDQHHSYVLDVPALDGGLNLRDAESALAGNESPGLLNLWREDGALRSRPGQTYAATAPTRGGTGFAATSAPFYGKIFLHIGDALYTLEEGDALSNATAEPVFLCSGVPASKGTFFRFGDWLFYKNRGGFFKITCDANHGTFSVSNAAEDAYVPTILINAKPSERGAGDIYQPENRLSAKKRVLYSASYREKKLQITASGVNRLFSLEAKAADGLRAVSSVYINGIFQPPALYSESLSAGTILFSTAPADGALIIITLRFGEDLYYLPTGNINSVDEVMVNGALLRAGRDYTVDTLGGSVTFLEPPYASDSGNNVSITYSRANPNALNAVMDCCLAGVCGVETQLCMVLAGSSSQPNAVFWSGSTDTGVDPSYFPMDAYNLLGDNGEEITAFGQQYGTFLVFKKRSTGKLTAEVETVNDRAVVSLRYGAVNSLTGCDLPGSVQVVENNVVFAATDSGGGNGGVFRVLEASAAYENNLQRVSAKADGSATRPGLLYDLRSGGAANSVTSFNDGQRYFLAVNSHMWVWDYAGGVTGGAWYYWTGFTPVAWFQLGGKIYHLNDAGRVTRLGNGVYNDYGAAIRKVYQFPVRYFGSYDRLKDITALLLSAPADVPSHTAVIYQTDHEVRADLTQLHTDGYDRLTERNLEQRDLSVARHSAVFRRRPKCRHIRHFAFKLESGEPGTDLAIYTVQIHYRFLGRDK